MRPWQYGHRLGASSELSSLMANEAFTLWPEELRDLIDEIQSIEALDVMCLVAADPSLGWRVDQLAEKLDTDRFVVDEAVSHLLGQELLARRPDGAVQYAIKTAERHAMMTVLARLCEEDRANVLGAIAQLSVDRIRSSAVRTFTRRPPR
jgi:predicted transcriptional regulator